MLMGAADALAVDEIAVVTVLGVACAAPAIVIRVLLMQDELVS